MDVYGYDMNSNSSLMSYNLKHHTRGFDASSTPGGLIPEDLRALALNKRVFSKSRFDPYGDIPPGYAIAKRIIVLGPTQIPGQPGVKVTTNSGQAFGTKVQNIVQGQIASSRKSGVATFDSATMWHSDASPTGWVSVQITFPFEVELSGVRVHSQHSGQYHAAQAVRVHGMTEKGILRRVAEQPLRSIDEMVPLPATRARTWEFEFQAGESKMVVLRGLQFYSSKDEIFPTLVPIGF